MRYDNSNFIKNPSTKFNMGSEIEGDGDLSNTPKLEDIQELFKSKEPFQDQEKITIMLYEKIIAPSLVSVNYGDIKGLIKSGDKYKAIFTNLNKISEFQQDVDSAQGVILIVSLGKDGTLDQLENKICAKYFSKNEVVISIAQILEEIPNDNPEINGLLVYREE
jgi:hypothetical protein